MTSTPSRLSSSLRNMIFNQTMIRVNDAKKSIQFYQDHFDLKLLHQLTFDDFSLYYLINGDIPNNTAEYLRSGAYGCTLELTHNHSDQPVHYANGNEPTHLGFAQLGFAVSDPQEKLKELAKTPPKEELIQKGNNIIITDPDGYHVELVQKDSNCKDQKTTFHHTTLRVKDGEMSVNFYSKLCGMDYVAKTESDDQTYTSHFVGTLLRQYGDVLPKPDSAEAKKLLRSYPGTLLELRHYHGTEKDDGFKYHNGNTEPRGFGHIAFMVDDLYEVCDAFDEAGVKFQKKPNEGRMKGLAFVLDPDGYWIEIIQKNLSVSA